MKKLHYKSSSIVAMENESGKSLFDLFDGIGSSISDTLLLFKAGGGTEDEFDSAVKEGGIEYAATLIMEGMAEAGFFGKEMKEIDVKGMLEATLSKKPTKNTGNPTKS